MTTVTSYPEDSEDFTAAADAQTANKVEVTSYFSAIFPVQVIRTPIVCHPS